jgi:hypothetical protein
MLDLHMNKFVVKWFQKKLTGNQNLDAEVNWTQCSSLPMIKLGFFSMPHEQKYLSLKRLAFYSQK